MPGLPDQSDDLLRGEPGTDDDTGPPPEGQGREPVLARSVATIVPTFNEGVGMATRAEALATHILTTSHIRAELAELRLNAHVALRDVRKLWRDMEGWEMYRERGAKTKVADDAAKTRADPKLADRIADAEWTVARCSEEMERLDKDATRCSQSHDILTGG